MSTMTLNKVTYKAFTESERKMTAMEKFRNYITENSAIIISGLAMLNGNTNAYRIYRMLSR